MNQKYIFGTDLLSTVGGIVFFPAYPRRDSGER